jgi:DNA-binding MarR family transcriptional regulator
MRVLIGNVMARSGDLREEHIAQVRRFDRLYERHINELQARAMINEVSWAESLVIHELGRVSGGRSPSWLLSHLDFDSGYMSRILENLCCRELVSRSPSPLDRRLREYELTPCGRSLHRTLEDFHRTEALGMLDLLPRQAREDLVHAMRTIEQVLARHPLPQFSQPWASPLRKRARYRLRR